MLPFEDMESFLLALLNTLSALDILGPAPNLPEVELSSESLFLSGSSILSRAALALFIPLSSLAPRLSL